MARYIATLALVGGIWANLVYWQARARVYPEPKPQAAVVALPEDTRDTGERVCAYWGRGFESGKRRPGTASYRWPIGTKLVVDYEGHAIPVRVGQYGSTMLEVPERIARLQGWAGQGRANVTVWEVKE